MFSAEEEMLAIEERLYGELLEDPSKHRDTRCGKIHRFSGCLRSLADVASERRYVRPVIDRSTDFIVKQGGIPSSSYARKTSVHAERPLPQRSFRHG